MAVVPQEELAARREALRRQINEQRRVIERDLEPPKPQHYEPHQYPRSQTMRFLVRNSDQLGKAVKRGLTLMMIAKMFRTSALVRTLATMALTRPK